MTIQNDDYMLIILYAVFKNCSFVFLQLYDSSQFFNGNEKPLSVPSTPAIQRALNVFDLIPPYETHKVKLVYITKEVEFQSTEIKNLYFCR